ncbi:MAG: DUF4942 domain-containing protein [Proteobacteria bacterium]|nr:DUF4942 domain-containing protein [Pseudomonadota bacterium]
MIGNKNFYPTPAKLIKKMINKVKNKNPRYILEPSAGKGDIIEAINQGRDLGYGRKEIRAIELDNDLFATLQGKDIEVIERDFLNYNGGDIFDLIIMNPPFDNGEKHLLKAIDILYSGEIICLLNAETLKNAYCNTRKELVKKLEELGADIEYIENGFSDAQRQTDVEIALIHIEVKKDIEYDLLGNASDNIKQENIEFETEDEANIALNDSIGALEVKYNHEKQKGRDAILGFYKSNCSSFIELKVGDCASGDHGKTSEKITEQINMFNSRLRKSYWDMALNIRVIREKLTSSNRNRFYAQLKSNSHLEFTGNNVRDFVINLIGSYEQTLIDACVELFDDFTHKYSYQSECDKNRLHYSTWKTNEAFKVNKKVIKPMYGSYGGYEEAFRKWGSWEIAYGIVDKLNDIDKVLNYIAGYRSYKSIAEAINLQMQFINNGNETSTACESTFFKIKFYKKGTLHLTFKDENLLRKFNIIACKGKGWLPDDYGNKEYRKYSYKEQETVDSFEGLKSYVKNFHDKAEFAQNNNQLLLAA